MDLYVLRRRPDCVFDPILSNSQSNSVQSALGFLWRHFVSPLSYTRIHDAFIAFVGCLRASRSNVSDKIHFQPHRLCTVDILSHVHGDKVERLGRW